MGIRIQRSTMIIFMFFITFSIIAADRVAAEVEFYPINHATLVIQSKDITIYVDPVGDPVRFEPFPGPDLILITDIHQDHLSKEVVDKVKQPETLVIATLDAVTQLGYGKVLNNGDAFTDKGVRIEAVPAYNLTQERMKFHPKGRGNGYVVTLEGKRIYLSGDTEDIPEMRILKNIDYAFICMNLPYTMTEDQAASAVLDFRPKMVFPYHYRGKNGFSDIERFKNLVEKDGDIQVKLLAWY